MPNKGHLAQQTLAADQARKKSLELTKAGVLSMQLVINPGEPSPELSGEDEFAQWCWEVLEENGVREKYKQILMLKGRHLNHFSNRADKIATMQDVCGTRLLPLPLPLAEMSDYTTVRVAFNAMLCAEGFKSIWTQGQDPPASVVEWWVDQDHDIFALLNGSDISATTTKLIRSRYQDSSCIGFLKGKMKDCYALRLAATPFPLNFYHMQVDDQFVLDKKEEKKILAAPTQVLQQVEEEVADPVLQQDTVEPERREADLRTVEEDREVEEIEADLRRARAEREERRRIERELRPLTERLHALQDPDSSLLVDPAVSTVVTSESQQKTLIAEASVAGHSTRVSRITRKCPHCVRTFSDSLRLRNHLENHH